MTRPTPKVTVNLAELDSLVREFIAEAAARKRRMELDAKVIGKLHTFYGARPPVPGQLVARSVRKLSEVIRGA